MKKPTNNIEMDIKSLLANKKLLFSVGGFLLVAIVIGAVYLPGALFKGDVSYTTGGISTVQLDTQAVTSPVATVTETVAAPAETFGNYNIMTESAETSTDGVPVSNDAVAVYTATAGENNEAAATDPGTTAAAPDEGEALEYLPATDYIGLNYTGLATAETVADSTSDEMTYNPRPAPSDADVASEDTGTEDQVATSTDNNPFIGTAEYSEDTENATMSYSVLDTATLDNTSSTESTESVYSVNTRTATNYILSCDAKSLTGTPDLVAGEQIQITAVIDPPVDQNLQYQWYGNELIQTTGKTVNALFETANTYYVSVTATPDIYEVRQGIVPVTTSLSARCPIVIEEAQVQEEDTSKTDTSDMKVICQGSPSEPEIGELVTWEAIPDTATTTRAIEGFRWLADAADAKGSGDTVYTSYKTAGVKTAQLRVTFVDGSTKDTSCSVEVQAKEEEKKSTEEESTDKQTTEPTQQPAAQEASQPESSTTGMSKCGFPYPDDVDGHWAQNYIKLGYDLCLFKGVEGKFFPDRKILRIEAASMILYAKDMLPDLKCYDNDCGTPFIDLESPEQGGIIRPLYLEDLIEGYSKILFKPSYYLTRAEAASMVVKAFFEPFPNNCTDPHCGAGWPDNFFTDIHDFWQGKYIRVLWDKKIMTGVGPHKVDPDSFITRAEMAKMIVLAYEKN